MNIALSFALGMAVGAIFFFALSRGVRVLVEGGAVSTALGLTLGRFLLVGAFLYVTARAGAAPLLAASAGIFVGRYLVIRALGAQER